MMNTISETILVLNRETDEYFAKDGQGREFLVGELHKLDELKLEPEFELFPA